MMLYWRILRPEVIAVTTIPDLLVWEEALIFASILFRNELAGVFVVPPKETDLSPGVFALIPMEI